jgi:L-ribulose-5-phosphate 3-epimerase
MISSLSIWAFAKERPLPEAFRIAKEAGFEGVEVAIADDGPITPASTQADCDRIRSEADAAGVRLVALASGMGGLYPVTSSDPAMQRKGIEVATNSLRVARQLGLDALLFVPGGVSAGIPYDLAYERTLTAAKELAVVAEENQVHLGLENVWNKFLLSPLEMRDFLDKVNSPFVGAYFDVGNVIIHGFPEQWIRILGNRIRKIHFKDFKRSVGTTAGFCDLGDGDVNWPAVLAALKETGYDGPVTAEFFNCEADIPKIGAAMQNILKDA